VYILRRGCYDVHMENWRKVFGDFGEGYDC